MYITNPVPGSFRFTTPRHAADNSRFPSVFPTVTVHLSEPFPTSTSPQRRFILPSMSPLQDPAIQDAMKFISASQELKKVTR